MKLYVTPTSPYARLARIVVIEKGLQHRVEVITAQTRTMGSPYYAINPSGRVPYLIDDADGLCEREWRTDGGHILSHGDNSGAIDDAAAGRWSDGDGSVPPPDLGWLRSMSSTALPLLTNL